jgi:hypothetical protein
MKKLSTNARYPALLAVVATLACGSRPVMAAEAGKEDPACEHHSDPKPGTHGKPAAGADPHAGHKPAVPPRNQAQAEGHGGHEGHGAADAAPAPAPGKARENRPMPEQAKARQAARRGEIHAMLERADELARNGKSEEAESLRRKAREQMGPSPRPGQVPGSPGAPHNPNPVAKLRHLQQAIGHLREAGLNEPAENLENMARRLREEIRQQERPRDGTAENEALRREVRELREALRKAQERP